MGSFSTKTKSKTTPIVSPWMDSNLQGYAGKVNNWLNTTDPSTLVTGPSALQQTAFGNAQNLGAGQGTLTDAIGMAKSAVSGAAPTATAANATATGYNPAQLGSAAQAGAAKLGPVVNANASLGSATPSYDLISKFMDPATQAYVTSTLGGFDRNAAEQRAQLEAAGAGARAFGGSRFGLAQSDLMDQQGMSRGQLQGQLLSQAFGQALQGAQNESAQQNQMSINNAGLQTQVSQGNAAAGNNLNATQGGFNQQASLANQQATNAFRSQQAQMAQEAAAAQAAAANQASMFNANNQTDVSKTNASLAAQQTAQQLAAAGLVGNLGQTQAQTQLGDVLAQGELGGQQRQITQAQNMAPATLLQLAGGMYGMIPTDSYIGQNMVGKSSPGLGAILAQMAGNAAQSYAMGQGMGG